MFNYSSYFLPVKEARKNQQDQKLTVPRGSIPEIIFILATDDLFSI